MKLELNKKQLVNLSQDAQVLPNELTPQVGGGAITEWCPEPSVHNPNQPGCNASDPSGFTHMCCHIP
ncbi:MAG: hypothetical protein CVV11_17635 [Gammaproteobacteria bacterium HGW-Gammaproteobacteria-15]|nr:MAG: hypothetical protein CVV11_17635 [Gammaproteobacteria bacterium HGW-Gammaproteobacteria-15]